MNDMKKSKCFILQRHGRIGCIKNELEHLFQFVGLSPIGESDLRLVHLQSHIDWVLQLGLIYEIVVLTVGGVMKAAELAINREPAFSLIRLQGIMQVLTLVGASVISITLLSRFRSLGKA